MAGNIEKGIIPDEPLEEFDTVEEVEALFRAQRRLSLGYGLVFLAGTLFIPLLSLISPAWIHRPVWGGMTANFLAVAFYYHLFYLILGLAYTYQANQVDEEMFGRPGKP